MDPVDALIRQSSDEIDRSAFGGEEIDKRDLGERDPCCAKSDVIEVVLGENVGIDGYVKGGDDGEVDCQQNESA